jgi:hypothetical protein
MSFARMSVQADLLSDLDIHAEEAVVLRSDAMPLAAALGAVTAGVTITSSVFAAQVDAAAGDAAG